MRTGHMVEQTTSTKKDECGYVILTTLNPSLSPHPGPVACLLRGPLLEIYRWPVVKLDAIARRRYFTIPFHKRNDIILQDVPLNMV
jgi:hypothetical protein